MQKIGGAQQAYIQQDGGQTSKLIGACAMVHVWTARGATPTTDCPAVTGIDMIGLGPTGENVESGFQNCLMEN